MAIINQCRKAYCTEQAIHRRFFADLGWLFRWALPLPLSYAASKQSLKQPNQFQAGMARYTSQHCPTASMQHWFCSVNLPDLIIEIVCLHGSAELMFRIYLKTCNAYAYLPDGPYHGRQVFSGRIQAEMQRLLTHSSYPSVWLKECSKFYCHLSNRGYPSWAINFCFRSFHWNQLWNMLIPKTTMQSGTDSLFHQYTDTWYVWGSLNLSL